MKKAVLDTNVFISGLINKNGPPGKILQAWKKGLFFLVTSPDIIEEINQTLREKEFSRLGIAEEDVRSLAFALVVNATVIIPEVKVKVVKEDPDDDKFLECALDGSADYIVSGDAHLLRFKEWRKIEIVPPLTFLKVIVNLTI